MSILFGHPSGGPFSHHAALAHFEEGILEAFCVPWMPTPSHLRHLRELPGLHDWTARLERRVFLPLLNAPRIEGKWGEWGRMAQRVLTPKWADERLSYEANDWLMQTMAQACNRSRVSAVHAYEDCSLLQFEQAKRLGKACIYDMPIGYYPAWEVKQQILAKEFVSWLPPGGLPSSKYVRPEQKRKEMELADLVLAPSSFVKETIQNYFPNKPVAQAPYGVDLEFWHPSESLRGDGLLHFLYAGQLSIRKGIPILLEAWRKADLKDAQLDLIGPWFLSSQRRSDLPPGVVINGACSSGELRKGYQSADVFVFPSFFEGFGLVILEAMACGLPVIATDATAGPDILDDNTGRIITAGNVDELVESLRWFANNRDRLPTMRRDARTKAETCTWDYYRTCVRKAVAPLAGRSLTYASNK